MPRNEVTYAQLVSHFTTFLTIAIHTILYERDVYPKETFLSARAYNFPVRQSRHPKVCQWITDAVSAVESELLSCSVSRVVVVLFDPGTNQPLERFVFDLNKFPSVARSDISTPFERDTSSSLDVVGDEAGQSSTKRNDDDAWVDLDEQLRGVLSKLSVCGSRLKPISEGSTFTVAIELKDDADPPIGHPQPWIPSEPTLQREKSGDGERLDPSTTARTETEGQRGRDLGGVRAVPLRGVEAGEMIFEAWIEEDKAKADGSQNSSGTTSTSFKS